MVVRQLSRTVSEMWEDPGTSRAIFYSVLLAVQFGFQPILMKECVSDGVISASMAFIQELCKLVLALIVIQMERGLRRSAKGWTLQSSLRGAAIPAASYAVQNILMLHSYHHLDFIAFNLLNQTKLLSTALFVYLLMGHRQSRMQVVALLMLVFSAFLLGREAKRSSSSPTPTGNSFWLGVVPLLTASMLSGLGGAMSQQALVTRNSFVYSLELAVYSVAIFALMILFLPAGVFGDRDRIVSEGLLVGWGRATVVPVAVQAAGGLCVGQVTKYAGGVKKGFAIVFGILLTTVLQELFYGISVSWGTCVALPFVLGSIVIHSLFPAPRKAAGAGGAAGGGKGGAGGKMSRKEE